MMEAVTKFRLDGKPMTLVVLAGGRSRRMGRDKAVLPVGGGVMIERVLRPLAGLFDEVVISVSSSRRARTIGDRLRSSGFLKKGAPPHPDSNPRIIRENRERIRCAVDSSSGQGPLRGILTGLQASSNEACFVVACDMPDLAAPAVRALVRGARHCDCAIAVGSNGLREPLFGVYRRGCIPAIEALLASGRRSVLDLYGRVRTIAIELDPDEMPLNLNTPSEFRSFIHRIKFPKY